MATSKQTYYDLSTMLLKVAATLPMPLSSQRYVAVTRWCLQSNWPLLVMFAVCGHSLVLQHLVEGSDE